jgi:hypothetical protein
MRIPNHLLTLRPNADQDPKTSPYGIPPEEWPTVLQRLENHESYRKVAADYGVSRNHTPFSSRLKKGWLVIVQVYPDCPLTKKRLKEVWRWLSDLSTISHRCTHEVSETTHGVVPLFDASMILFYPIIEILVRPMHHLISQCFAHRTWKRLIKF